jgi:D-sedoheptulose 7-phosphate isomerase
MERSSATPETTSAPGSGRETTPEVEGRSALRFLSDVKSALGETRVTDVAGGVLPLDEGLARALALLRAATQGGGKAMFIGNGGSAGIASHVSVDMWKCANMEAIAFNDASLLTCIGNDFGYEQLFVQPVRRFGRRGDVLVAISSSGRSPNILNGVDAARAVGCAVITLSGFSDDNPLRKMGDVNFHVPHHNYGLVEITHLALAHSLLDAHNGYGGGA